MTARDASVLDKDGAGGVDRQFPARAEAVRDARVVLGDWLAEVARVGAERVADLLLVASEMASNAVRAEASWFRLRAWLEETAVALEVADDGPGFDAPVPGLEDVPALDSENGRGLFLVRALVDRCTIFTSENGTIVRCRITLPT